LLLCLLLPALAAPGPPVHRQVPVEFVHDSAGLFKEEVIRRADLEIAAIREHHDLALYVETIKHLPKDAAARLSGILKTKREKDQYLSGWARKEAVRKKFDGVYAVICLDPRFVFVVGSSDEVDARFSRAQQDEVRQQFDRSLRRHNYDDALLSGVAIFREILDNPSPVDFWVLALVLGALLGFWGCLVVMLKRGTAAAVPAGARGERRADRLPAMLGAMFGTPAGFWVYDRLFQGGPAAPPDRDRHLADAPTAADPLATLVTPSPLPAEVTAPDDRHDPG
jgi:hypothetical protein